MLSTGVAGEVIGEVREARADVARCQRVLSRLAYAWDGVEAPFSPACDVLGRCLSNPSHSGDRQTKAEAARCYGIASRKSSSSSSFIFDTVCDR